MSTQLPDDRQGNAPGGATRSPAAEDAFDVDEGEESENSGIAFDAADVAAAEDSGTAFEAAPTFEPAKDDEIDPGTFELPDDGAEQSVAGEQPDPPEPEEAVQPGPTDTDAAVQPGPTAADDAESAVIIDEEAGSFPDGDKPPDAPALPASGAAALPFEAEAPTSEGPRRDDQDRRGSTAATPGPSGRIQRTYFGVALAVVTLVVVQAGMLLLPADQGKTVVADVPEVPPVVVAKKAPAIDVDIQAIEKQLATAREMIRELENTRDDAETKASAREDDIRNLKLEIDKLNKQLADLKSPSVSDFAGLSLTGENVIFIIDAAESPSLSMYRDSKQFKFDKKKWHYLCDRFEKLMKSIPTLKRFQVILIGEGRSYLIGDRGRWYQYVGADSAWYARSKLLDVDVGGARNLHDAFAEALYYREQNQKVDAIYFLSCGFPNAGPVDVTNIQKLTEEEKQRYTAEHLRKKISGEWNLTDKNLNDVRINAIGFFSEDSQFRAFLSALTRDNRGSSMMLP